MDGEFTQKFRILARPGEKNSRTFAFGRNAQRVARAGAADAGAAILRELKNDLQSKDLKIILLSYFGKPEGFEEFIGEKNIKCFSKSEYAAKELADEIKILIS